MGNMKRIVGNAIRFFWKTNPSKMLYEQVCEWFADQQVIVFLGDAGTGKTELMCLFKDYQECCFFSIGDQRHSDELGKTASREDARVLLGNSLMVMDEGQGAYNSKKARMDGIADFISEYMTDLAKKMDRADFHKRHGRMPLYCFFLVNLKEREFDKGTKDRLELRCFHDYILNNEEIRKMHLKDMVKNEKVCMKFDLRFLFIGTHLERGGEERELAKRLERYANRITEAEFGPRYKVAALVADIKSPEGRSEFIQQFKKKKEVFND